MLAYSFLPADWRFYFAGAQQLLQKIFSGIISRPFAKHSDMGTINLVVASGFVTIKRNHLLFLFNVGFTS
jgi:hypothetical protein